jgi:hypothetical protein
LVTQGSKEELKTITLLIKAEGTVPSAFCLVPLLFLKIPLDREGFGFLSGIYALGISTK